MPREVRVTLGTSGREILAGVAEDPRDVDEHTGTASRPVSPTLVVLRVGCTEKEVALDWNRRRVLGPRREPQENGSIAYQRWSLGPARHEAIEKIAGPEQPAACFTLNLCCLCMHVHLAMKLECRHHANGIGCNRVSC